jgi:hypothetical protein
MLIICSVGCFTSLRPVNEKWPSDSINFRIPPLVRSGGPPSAKWLCLSMLLLLMVRWGGEGRRGADLRRAMPMSKKHAQNSKITRRSGRSWSRLTLHPSIVWRRSIYRRNRQEILLRIELRCVQIEGVLHEISINEEVPSKPNILLPTQKSKCLNSHNFFPTRN